MPLIAIRKATVMYMRPFQRCRAGTFARTWGMSCTTPAIVTSAASSTCTASAVLPSWSAAPMPWESTRFHFAKSPLRAFTQ